MSHDKRVSRSEKLFRAIVVMGAAMTTGACFDPPPPCTSCVPDAPPDTVAVSDAGADAPSSPKDAPVDVVLIL